MIRVVPKPLPETTDPKRRVLAHERVLQALIAYMSRAEPRFVDHLKRRFVEPMSMARREHDYRDSDDYAEAFIRAVMLLGETQPPAATGSGDGVTPLCQPEGKQPPWPGFHPEATSERVRTRERNGIWEVKVDGVFYGDYHVQGHALAAAALARLTLR